MPPEEKFYLLFSSCNQPSFEPSAFIYHVAMVKKIICLLSTVSCLLSCVSFARAQEKTIRVAIAQEATNFYIRIKGSYEVRELPSNRLIRKGNGVRKQKAMVQADKIAAPSFTLLTSRVQIVPLKGTSIYINNRIYRGKINLIRKSKEGVLITNELGIEDYVKGILCKEIAPWWPMDALKAQSIIARTYALYQKQFPKDKDFDMTDDIYSQVYGGKTSERWRTNRAVDLTKGKILTFQDKGFPAFYHATCGGATEDASQLWKIDLAPLKGVSCGFCKTSPHFSWKKEMPVVLIRQKLFEKGYSCPDDIQDIEIMTRNGSGRVTRVLLKGEDSYAEISGKDFRQALDPNLVRSGTFTIKIVNKVAYIEGLGWGHGAGLCQWGMYAMAKEGYPYTKILSHYFPRSQIDKAE